MKSKMMLCFIAKLHFFVVVVVVQFMQYLQWRSFCISPVVVLCFVEKLSNYFGWLSGRQICNGHNFAIHMKDQLFLVSHKEIQKIPRQRSLKHNTRRRLSWRRSDTMAQKRCNIRDALKCSKMLMCIFGTGIL